MNHIVLPSDFSNNSWNVIQYDLKIMIDEINQPKDEKEYKNEHRNITVIIHKFLKEYKLLKKDLFDMIKNIKKTQKQKRLIN